MPDVSKHLSVLQDLKSNALPTLGVSLGPITVTPDQKIDKKGENIDKCMEHWPRIL